MLLIYVPCCIFFYFYSIQFGIQSAIYVFHASF